MQSCARHNIKELPFETEFVIVGNWAYSEGQEADINADQDTDQDTDLGDRIQFRLIFRF